MSKLLIATSAMAITIASSHPVAAQSAGEQANAEAAASGAIQTIVVTAQRRQETLQDAAIPINAVSGEELANSGVNGAMGLNRVAPALVVNSPGGANAGYFVRGVGNFSNNGYTAPAVAFNLDGVYIGRPSSTIASFLDLNRVEVLKGPQGTLYGRNATGGAINVIPNRPQLGEFSGNASAQYGNYDAYQLTGVINLPIGPSMAARFAATVDKHDGYYSDGTGDADNLAFRGQILAELNDDMDVRFSVDYSEQNGIGGGLDTDGVYGFLPGFLGGASLPVPNHPLIAAPANVAAPFTGLFAPQTLAFIQANGSSAPLFSPVTGYDYPYRNDKYFGVNAEFNFDLGETDLVVIPAFRRSELDNQFNGAPFRVPLWE